MRFLFSMVLALAALPGMALELNALPLLPEVRQLRAVPGDWLIPAEIKVSLPAGQEELMTLFPGALTCRAVATETPDIRLSLDPKLVPEGYRLIVSPEGVKIAAAGRQGFLHALRTLDNLLLNRSGNSLPGCEINDSPALKMRGVFMNLRGLNTAGIPVFKKLVDLYGSLKMNCLILEFGENLPLTRQKFNRKTTLSREEVADLLAYIRFRGMQVIPYLQTFSHVVWLTSHPEYQSLLENPADAKRWEANWCPSNPRVQAIIGDIIDETAALIQPEYFHIGLDELDMGAFRYCERCRRQAPEELFGKQLDRLFEMVKRNGAAPILYQDSLVPPVLSYTGTNKTGGYACLDRLPKEAIIQIWNYDAEPPPELIRYFTDRSIKVLGAAWFPRMDNVRRLPGLLAAKGEGCILTFWYYLPWNLTDVRTVGNPAWPGILLAGNYFWNPGGTPVENLNFDPVFEARRRWMKTPRTSRLQPVSLAARANVVLNGDRRYPVFTGPQREELKKELGEAGFALLTEGAGFAGIGVGGDFPVANAEVKLSGKAERLSFLLTTVQPADKALFTWQGATRMPQLGALTVGYADGGKAEIPLSYRWNLVEWNAKFSAFGCRFVSRVPDAGGRIVQFSAVDWVNPKPRVAITSLSLRTSGREPLLLLALAADPAVEVAAGVSPERVAFPQKPEAPPVEIKIVDLNASRLPVTSDDSFRSLPRATVGNEPGRGQLLRLQVPALKPDRYRGRVYLDLEVANLAGCKAVEFDLNLEKPEWISNEALYLGNQEFREFRVQYRLRSSGRPGWQTVCIPLEAMSRERGAVTPENMTRLRLSFWVGNRQPMTVRVAGLTGLDRVPAALSLPGNQSIAE